MHIFSFVFFHSFATDKRSARLSVHHLSAAETQTFSYLITQSLSGSDSCLKQGARNDEMMMDTMILTIHNL